MMLRKTCAAFVLGGLAATTASAGGFALDQNQPSGPTYMAGFSQTDLAQSFQTQQGSLATVGAGILLQGGIGSSDLVRISLYDALPNAGGNLLAQGEATGTQGEWVDVFWTGVNLTPDTTYFLVFDGNTTLGIAGDTSGPYPHGHVYANAGFSPFTGFDYAFRTWVIPTPGAFAIIGLAGLASTRRRR
ncbi:MAG: PEP-CTERM sorting domain-containing protein [Phycisphaerales bacterium]